MGESDVEIEEMLFLNPSPLWGEGRVRGRFSCARITIAMLPIERE